MKKSLNNSFWHIFLFAAIATGIALRLTLRHSSALWEDEVIAATQAIQPFVQSIITVLMNDIHPPLYFLQLHAWSLLGKSDLWFIVNSILFSLAAILSIFLVQKKFAGFQAGLAAAAVMAVLPAAIWMGEEVRPYAWLSVLLIWMLHFTRRAFAAPGQNRRDCAMIAILAFAIIYSHAIGFIAVLFFGLYAASFLWARRAASREWMIWAAVFGFAGLMILPMMASDLLHPADMAPPHGIASMIEWTASVITGAGAANDVALRLAGALAYAGLTLAGTAYAPTRRMTLCFVIGPIMLCIATSLAIRPLFKTNFFSTFLSPFIAIITAQLLLAVAQPKARAALSVFVLCGLAAMAITNRQDLPSNTYYAQAANTISADKRLGDVVWMPQTDVFWGMAWYLIGPDWGSPLDVREPFRTGSHWWKVFLFLGPNLVTKLHLIPISQTAITKEGIPLMMGESAELKAEQGKRIWLVTFGPRSDLSSDLPSAALGTLHLNQSFSYPPLQVSLYK